MMCLIKLQYSFAKTLGLIGCLVFHFQLLRDLCVAMMCINISGRRLRLISVNTYDCSQFLGTFGSSLHRFTTAP